MATNEEYQELVKALSGECERLHKENEELKKALSQISDIKAIINNPMYIQEDVLRYQMICEVVKE